MQMETQPEQGATPPATAAPRPSAQTTRLLVYIAAVVVCAILMLTLPSPYPTYVFAVLVGGSVLFAAREVYTVHRLSAATVDGGASETPAPRIHLPKLHLPSVTRVPLVARILAHVRSRAGFYTPLFTLIAIALMIYSGYTFTQYPDGLFPTDAVAQFLLGVVAMGAAVGVSGYGKPQPMPVAKTEAALAPPRTALNNVVAVVITLLGVAMLAAVAEINGRGTDLEIFMQVSTHIQFALFLGGAVFVGWGLSGAPSPLRLRYSIREIDPKEALIIIGILALAFFMRFWQLETSLRQLIDELHWADAIRILNWDPNTRLLTQMSGQGPYTWIYPYWEALGAQVFGNTLTGMRFASTVIGVFTVLATYGIARALFDRRLALFAGVLIAVFPAHVHFSRIAMTLIGDPLFGTMMVMFMARGWKYNRRIDWAFAGVSLGMTQYFYEGGRLLYPPLAVGWVALMFLVDRKPLFQRLRAQWKSIIIMAAAGVIVAVPAYYTILAGDQPLAGRMNDSGLGGQFYRDLLVDGLTVTEIQEVLERWSWPFMFYVHRPEVGGMYLGGDQPLVLDILVPIFLLGTAYAIWRWRYPANILVLWVVATAIGNALFIRDNIVSPRYVVVMPALAILLAAGVRYTFPLLMPSDEPDKGFFRRWVPVGLVTAITALQIWYYWNPYIRLFNEQVRDYKWYRDGIDASLRAAELPRETLTILIGAPVHDQNVPRNMLGYLQNPDVYPLLSIEPDDFSPKYILDLPRDRNYAFFVEVGETAVVDLIYRYFPLVEAPQYTTTDMDPGKAYVLFFAPASLYDLYEPVKAQP
jgi:hypothetical protein